MQPLVRKYIDVNKAIVHSVADTAQTVGGIVADGVAGVTRTLRTTGATMVGQARAAGEHTVDTATAGAKQVGGQAASAGRRTTDAAAAGGSIADELERTADRSLDAIDPEPSSGTPYEQWTKGQLYERAQELDIEGRSTMSKRELVRALRG